MNVDERQFSSSTSRSAFAILGERSEDKYDFDSTGSDDSFKEFVRSIDVSPDHDK